MTIKPRLLILSQVLPFPRNSGQQQRVFYTLKAVRDCFRVTFATAVNAMHKKEVHNKLSALCDEVVLLPSQYSRSAISKCWHKGAGTLYSLKTGLKMSNYVVGRLELSLKQVALLLKHRDYDCVLYEYWHAVDTVPLFREKAIPCVLDMHNILWQSYNKQLDARSRVPKWWKERVVKQYKAREEHAWQQFDGIVAINAAEGRYVRSKVLSDKQIFYTPMGVDIDMWPYSWRPATPHRIAYYGGLSSQHNQHDALRCYETIMPEIWKHYPDVEFWIIGNKPPASIQALEKDPRVKVTGFVKRVQDVLKEITALICPWSGTYGFRSRLIEAMALGVPVVTSPDAVYGMDLEIERGLFLEDTDEKLAEACIRLLTETEFAKQQSQFARAQVEEKFSFQTTYGRLAKELLEFCKERRVQAQPNK